MGLGSFLSVPYSFRPVAVSSPTIHFPSHLIPTLSTTRRRPGPE